MRFFKLRTNLINILFDVIAHFYFHGTIYISGTDGFNDTKVKLNEAYDVLNSTLL